jgi:hypothetical protein
MAPLPQPLSVPARGAPTVTADGILLRSANDAEIRTIFAGLERRNGSKPDADQ